MGYVMTPAVKDMPSLMLERYLVCCNRQVSLRNKSGCITQNVFTLLLFFIFIDNYVSSLSLMPVSLASYKY
jgi:hypothetical protein